MSSSLNKVQLIGNLGADPKIVTFQSGDRAAQLSLATSETWNDKTTGEKKEATEWHRIVVYPEPKVGFCERYLKKGMRIYVEGSLRTRKWTDEKTGADRWTTELVVRARGEIMILSDRKPGGGGEGDRAVVPDDRGGQGGRPQASTQARGGNRPFQGGGQWGGDSYGGGNNDDGLPF